MKILRRSSELALDCLDVVRRNSADFISQPTTPVMGKSPQNSTTSEDSMDDRDRIKESQELLEKFLFDNKTNPKQFEANLEKLLTKSSGQEKKIDGGIQVALAWINRQITTLSRGRDTYTKLLFATVLQDSEAGAIMAVKKLTSEDQIALIKGSRRIRPTPLQSIPMDALRLAALSKRTLLLRELISIAKKNNLDFACIDDSGWCLAHFLALQLDEASIRNDFPEIEQMLTKPNKAGATPLDFIEWRKEPSPVSIRAFATLNEFVKPAALKKNIGHYFWKLPCFSPAALLSLAYKTPTPTTPVYLVKALLPTIEQYIENKHTPSKIQIRKLEGKKLPKELQNKWEAVAAKPLMRGEVIALYSGKVFDKQWLEENDQPGDGALPLCGQFMIDPEHGGGSLAEFINHGFPNCAPIECLYKGMPVTAIIALDTTDPGTVLCMQNGPKYPVEMNQEGKKGFLKTTNKLKNIPKIAFTLDKNLVFCAEKGKTALKKLTPSDNDLIEAWSNTTKLEYLNDSDPKLRKKTQVLLTNKRT